MDTLQQTKLFVGPPSGQPRREIFTDWLSPIVEMHMRDESS